jgi:hypothetical protein
MGKTSIVCVFLVFALLLEDGSSVRKRTEEEEKEDREIAKAVNRTLAEEEKRREEDEKKKRTEDEIQGKKEDKDEKTGVKDKVDQQEGQSEADPSLNCTCPVVKPCRPCQSCPVANCTGQCDSCPEKECPEVKPCLPCDDCGPCPEVKPCKPCRPCGPCPMVNSTSQSPPEVICSEPASMTIPEAMAVGAVASLLVTGVATAIGLLLRYIPPVTSGFVFLATIVIVWYFSSQHPETARELGGRAATLLREAATALSHRVMEALRHHNEQVGFSSPSLLFFKLSSIFFISKSLH